LSRSFYTPLPIDAVLDELGRTLTANNAGQLLKGAKKVPKGTLFFIGQNGQLYIRTGPYLEGDGKFMFGSN
jgi:hypothetical protein